MLAGYKCLTISILDFSSHVWKSELDLLRTIVKTIINHVLFKQVMSSGKQALLYRERHASEADAIGEKVPSGLVTLHGSSSGTRKISQTSSWAVNRWCLKIATTSLLHGCAIH